MTYLPHQQRVIEEKAELDERFKKLIDFQETETFDSLGAAECESLYRQAIAMLAYSEILGERIARFK